LHVGLQSSLQRNIRHICSRLSPNQKYLQIYGGSKYRLILSSWSLQNKFASILSKLVNDDNRRYFIQTEITSLSLNRYNTFILSTLEVERVQKDLNKNAVSKFIYVLEKVMPKTIKIPSFDKMHFLA
jgi:hypothetical protein